MEEAFQALVEKLQELSNCTKDSKRNKELYEESAAFFEAVDAKSEDTSKQLAVIRNSWFEALDMQAESERLSNRIIKKLDKVGEVQREVAMLIDSLSQHIENFDVVPVNGESSDMLLQK